ncbi:MAG: mevalonate kinase [Chloroflexota bacterium]|nr:mevalonate kinase [Chloroflexota bacterium]
MISASAPAKIILFGEHAVVYGVPAIAIPVSSLRATATVEPQAAGSGLRIHAVDTGRVLSVGLQDEVEDALVEMAQLVLKRLHIPAPDASITLRSDIPMASGLGSGAAVSTALARALSSAVGKPLEAQALNELVYEIEKRHHGTPSGIDNTVICYEQPVYFVRGEPIQPLHVGGTFHFIIADTGQASLTKPAVAAVRALYNENKTFVENILHEIGKIVDEARTALGQGDAKALGSLMIANHALLQSLTVSSPDLDRLVSAALDANALGAKLSGGGRGGNMIALADERNHDSVTAALYTAGAARIISMTLS